MSFPSAIAAGQLCHKCLTLKQNIFLQEPVTFLEKNVLEILVVFSHLSLSSFLSELHSALQMIEHIELPQSWITCAHAHAISNMIYTPPALTSMLFRPNIETDEGLIRELSHPCYELYKIKTEVLQGSLYSVFHDDDDHPQLVWRDRIRKSWECSDLSRLDCIHVHVAAAHEGSKIISGPSLF